MKSVLIAAAAILSLAASPALADPAQNGPWLTALSLLGAPKYQPGFAHWDYVDPDAPKGGLARLSTLGTFDSFNPILAQGDPAVGTGYVYEMLMTGAMDDTSASYPLIANAVAYPPDISSVTFRIDPRAKWQDGQPITPQDVAWSFQKETSLNPNLQSYWADVSKVEVTAPDQVTFFLSTTGNREMPVILGQVTVLPQHWWEGKDANGKQRDIGASTLELPMGSGPYKLVSFEAGSSVTYQRDPNYWAANLPEMVGENNFDTLRFEYFRDPTVSFEAFKGDQFDWWSENRAKRWASSYDFPAVQQGKVVRELFPQPFADSGDMVAFIPNLRLDKFKDQRVREALNWAFDFEDIQKTVFYGEYFRVNSYFFRLPFASSGLPQGKELDILNSVKDKIPPEVFTTPYTNPVGGDPAKVRDNLRHALDLFAQAGYHVDNNRLVDANGTQFSFELLLDTDAVEPLAIPYQQSLKSIGIDMQIRPVDDAEYTQRMRDRNFEMTYNGWTQSLSPGNEQQVYFGSKSANDPNTSNFGGIADPGVDALIDQIIHAPDRDTLLATATAMDRVLLAHHYVIPSYAPKDERIARWDRFSHPDKLPDYSIGFPDIWWFDEAKAEKAGKAQ